jgi:hypothetical protein
MSPTVGVGLGLVALVVGGFQVGQCLLSSFFGGVALLGVHLGHSLGFSGPGHCHVPLGLGRVDGTAGFAVRAGDLGYRRVRIGRDGRRRGAQRARPSAPHARPQRRGPARAAPPG